MNKWIFGAAMFCVMLNFATFIIPKFIPGIDVAGTGFIGIPTYQKDMATGLIKFSNETRSNAESTMTDKGSLIYRVLDMINIGFIRAFDLVLSATELLYAFPNLMMSITGPMFDDGTMAGPQYLAIKTTLYTLFSIGYGLFIFGLWSGRDLRDD